MKQPTLSMTMTNYNHAHFLPEAMQSIAEQSYQPMEWIIIDDGSTDNSVEILEGYAQKYSNIQLIRNEQNKGIIYNLNRLLELASGDYVVGLASDDKFLPGFFEKAMQLLKQYPQAGLCSAGSWIIDEAGNRTSLVTSLPLVNLDAGYLSPEQALYLLQYHGSWVCTNVTIYKRQALLEAGGYIQKLGSFSDSFIQEVLALRHGACFIREPLGASRFMITGYAITTSTKSESELTILAHAVELMTTEYQALFPPEYIDVAIKRWLRRYSMLNWQKLLTEHRHFVTNVAKRFEFSGDWWFDYLILAGMKLFMLVHDMAVKVLLSLRFGIPYSRLPAEIQKIYRLYNTHRLKKWGADTSDVKG